jgi:hypothetical protein
LQFSVFASHALPDGGSTQYSYSLPGLGGAAGEAANTDEIFKGDQHEICGHV